MLPATDRTVRADGGSVTELARTPLHDVHVALGARMVPFAGFSMPVQYASIKAEHAAVREGVGLFDVSHMGQIHFEGPSATEALERLVTCPVASLRAGRVRYGMLCNHEGGVVDDVTLYRVTDEHLFLCVNAANIEKDWRWCVRHTDETTKLSNRSATTGLLALQGPGAEAVVSAICPADLGGLRNFRFIETECAGHPTLLSRTGYTGADGFELYFPAEASESVWTALTRAGAEPCGLGARDTLRLEAALSLYGHELDDDTSPLEAGLDRFVKLDAGGYIGHEAVLARREAGHTRQLVGFEMTGRGIARAGYPIAHEGDTVGTVTSGAPSPTLGKSIGLGYVPPALAEPGRTLDVIVRDRPIAARVVPTPFVKKS